MFDMHIQDADRSLQKATADFEPDLLTGTQARAKLEACVQVHRRSAYLVAALTRRVNDAESVARVTGTSIGQAKDTLATSEVLAHSPVLNEALKHGEVSLEQATEIAKAEASAPGVASQLVTVAKKESFLVLKDKARAAKLAAEQHKDLAARQHAARRARSYSDSLAMIHIHMELEPHVGTPIVARAEAEAARLAKAAKKNDAQEPFERHLADAYAALMSGKGKGRAKRPELVVLVSHSVAKRGWRDVKKGEVCKIPGVGPVSPQVAKEIAADAFLSGVLFDGKDLRHFARWSRHIPVEVLVALELGDPPEFDGIRCIDCGNRFRTEFDHIEPRAARGPTSKPNLGPRCWPCHRAKTARDRRAGKLKPQGTGPRPRAAEP